MIFGAIIHKGDFQMICDITISPIPGVEIDIAVKYEYEDVGIGSYEYCGARYNQSSVELVVHEATISQIRASGSVCNRVYIPRMDEYFTVGMEVSDPFMNEIYSEMEN